MTDQETPDRKIADLAGASYGVVDRAALLGADLTEHEINGRIQRGVLRAVHRCVYAVGHTALSREGRWVAAVLACGEGALLSHWSAAALWELVEEDPGWPHVTTERSCARRESCRTGAGSRRKTEHVGTAYRSPQWRGRSSIWRRSSPRISSSDSSARRHEIPRPLAQVGDARKRPDFVWPAQRLVVEADSWLAHGTPHAFQADRTQSNAVQLAGWTILRFTYADVMRRPRLVAAQLTEALGVAADRSHA